MSFGLDNLLLFVFSVIGLTHIIVDSSIFAPVRAFLQKKLPTSIYKVFECYQCAGTWCGFLIGLILISNNPFVVFVCGCAGSFLASLAAFYLNYLEAKTMIAMDNKDNNE